MIARVWKSAVLWAFLATALRLGGFIFVLPVTLRTLSPERLGIWYTMGGLSALVWLVEAGFSPCLGRFASYYFAGAKKVPSLGMGEEAVETGASPNYSALAGLVRLARTVYRRFAVAALLYMAVGGSLWLGTKFHQVFLQADVWPAYLLFSVTTALTADGFFWGDLLSGTHQVRNSYTNFILGLVLNYVVTVVLLLLGFGLMSMAIGGIIVSVLPRQMARRQYLKVFPTKDYPHPQLTAMGELLPMCWRSGLAAFAAYLLGRSMTLISAQVLDLRATASLGLSMQFGFMLSGVAQSWMVVKYPVFIQLRAKRDEAGLRRLVHRRMTMCLSTYAGGAVFAMLVAPTAIHLMGSRTPLLPPALFAMLLAVMGLDHYMGLNTAIMLGENRVRHLIPFLASGLATLVLSLVGGHWFGLIGIILAPFVAQIFWNYWWAPKACWDGLRLKTAGEIQAES